MEIPNTAFGSIKAKKGIRTLNINLGKVILYHWAIFANNYLFLIIKNEFNNKNNSLACMNNDLNKDKKTKKVYKYKTKDGIILTKEDHFNLFKFLCPYQKPRNL